MDHGEGILVGFKDWYPTKQSFNHVMSCRVAKAGACRLKCNIASLWYAKSTSSMDEQLPVLSSAKAHTRAFQIARR
jgi:hypothetical protein